MIGVLSFLKSKEMYSKESKSFMRNLVHEMIDEVNKKDRFYKDQRIIMLMPPSLCSIFIEAITGRYSPIVFSEMWISKYLNCVIYPSPNSTIYAYRGDWSVKGISSVERNVKVTIKGDDICTQSA